MSRNKGSITRTPIIKRHMTREEFLIILHAFKFVKHRVLIRVLRYEGLRISEALKLNIHNKPNSNHLDLEKGTILFNQQKNGNDGEIWYIRKRTHNLLKQYIKVEGFNIRKNNGWLFWSSWTGSHLKMGCLQSTFHRMRMRVNLTSTYGNTCNGGQKHRICFHTLKHEHHREVLKNMVHKWGKIDTISALMMTRHKSISGLQPYINEIHEVKKSLTNELMN